MGEDSKRPSEHSGSGSRASSWSLPPVDLSGDKALVGAETMAFEGEERPSVGKIALLRELGRGGMGVVYFGVNPRLQREVAVKVLPSALKEREDTIVERFVQEARFAAHLQSPHLVNVLDVDRDEPSGAHFIVMEYVNGRSAREWMEDLEASGRLAPEKAALEVCIGATRGLKSAHMEGILHRDIKPHNILIPADKNGMLLFDRAKLADLGLARPEQTEQELTSSQIGMGTPGYVSPEQAQDARTAKKSSDVFGMGATLYGMLTGTAPFRGKNSIESILKTVRGDYKPIREVRPDVSEPTAAVIKRCLPPDPDDRFKDASSLLEALELAYNALKQADTAENTINLVTNLVRQKERGKKVVVRRRQSRYWHAQQRRRSSPTAAIAIGAVALLAALAFFLLGRDKGGGEANPGLYVSSNPEGATIRIDGEKKGITPQFLPGLSGTVHIRLTKRGYQPFERKRFLVAEGERVEISPVLSLAKGGMIEVNSVPHGAMVTVDGRERGLTPLVVRNLDDGKHVVSVALKGYEAQSNTIGVRAGQSVPWSVTLVRIKPTLTVLGPAGAEVSLKGPRDYSFRLDRFGRAEREVEPGDYEVRVTRGGYEEYTSRLTAGGRSARLDVKMHEQDGRLTVTTVPPGAEVLVDAKPVGKTPLRDVALPPGKHEVVFRLANHVDETRTCEVRGDQVLDLGRIAMRRWCTLDLSALDVGVVALIDNRPVQHGARIAPGRLTLTLERPGYADQALFLTATEGPLKVFAQPWDRFQARLRLAPLPEGARVIVDDKDVPGRLLTLDDNGAIDLRIVRPGYAEVTLSVPVELGQTRDLPRIEWKKIVTRLDLSDFPRGAKYVVGRDTWRHGDVIPAGDHEGKLVIPGKTIPDVRIRVTAQQVVRPTLTLLNEKAVLGALAWLARTQQESGVWIDVEGSGTCGTGVTGLALLCFLRAGETPEIGPHKDQIAKGLKALIKAQDQEGCIGPRGSLECMFNHACAALAVIEAYRRTGNEEFRPTAARAIDFVVNARNPGMGWRYSPRSGNSDTIVTGWMVRVLAAGEAAGIAQVDAEVYQGARNWLDQVTDPGNGRAGYMVRGGPPSRIPALARPPPGETPREPSDADFPARKTESPTAVAVLARLLMAPSPHSERMIDRGFKLLRSRLPRWDDGSIDMHYWYFGTLASYQEGGSGWRRWARAVERLERKQVGSGPNAGSWDPIGAWGRHGGRVYSTAAICLSLATVYRYEGLK